VGCPLPCARPFVHQPPAHRNSRFRPSRRPPMPRR
jgi:hypothetical protein